MVANLMIIAKLATLGLPKAKVFRNKSYNIVISFHYVTSKILSSDSNYVADAVV